MTAQWEQDFTRLAGQVLHSMQEHTSPPNGPHYTERAPIVRLADSLLEHAVDLRASDLHIEPQKDALRFRYRVDGLLRECHVPLSPKLQPPLRN